MSTCNSIDMQLYPVDMHLYPVDMHLYPVDMHLYRHATLFTVL